MHTVSELKRERKTLSKKRKLLYNPLKKDFICKFIGNKYTIKSMEITEFPYFVADHVRKHLIDAVINEREVNPTLREEVRKIEKEIDLDD